MIKVEQIRSKSGFTKEQLSDLAVQLLEALNKKEGIAEIENIQKIETTVDYKNMIERLKRA